MNSYLQNKVLLWDVQDQQFIDFSTLVEHKIKNCHNERVDNFILPIEPLLQEQKTQFLAYDFFPP